MSYAALLRKTESKTAAPSRNLRIGEPSDSFEREADRVAEEVTAGRELQWSLSRIGAGAPLRRKCACGGSGECEECKENKILQRKPADGAAQAGYAPPIVHDVLRSPGQPLDSRSRAFLEPRFGYDFSRVRIHTDAQAAQSAKSVNAKAYAVGNHIAFAEGRFAPSTRDGSGLLAHELAHVVQQRGAAAALQRSPDEKSKEWRAYVQAARDLETVNAKLEAFKKTKEYQQLMQSEQFKKSKEWRAYVQAARALETVNAKLEAFKKTKEYQQLMRLEAAKAELVALRPEVTQMQKQIAEARDAADLEKREKTRQMADWVARGERARPTKSATLLMPDEAQQAELSGRIAPPIRHISGKWYQYGLTIGRFKVIYPDNFGGGIVEVTSTGYYYNLPEREFNDLFGTLGISDAIYQNTKGVVVAYGYFLKAAGEIANFTRIGGIVAPLLSTAGEGYLYEFRKEEAIMAGDEFTETAPEIGVGTIVQTAGNLIGTHIGGRVEAATGSSLAGVFAGMYSGGAVQKGYEAAKGERSVGSVFAPPSPEDILIGYAEGKVAGYGHGGWTRGRAPVGGHSEGTPTPSGGEKALTTEQSRTTGEPSQRLETGSSSKASPNASEDAIRQEVHEAASKAGSELKLGDGVHGMAAAGEGKEAGVEFCSPECSLAARRLRKAADDLSKNPQAKNPKSEAGKLVQYLRDTGSQLDVIDKELQQGKISKLTADIKSAQVAGELRIRAMKYPELDRVLQSDPKKAAASGKIAPVPRGAKPRRGLVDPATHIDQDIDELGESMATARPKGESYAENWKTARNPLDLPEIQESIEAARRELGNLPEAPGTKTVAGIEGGEPKRSGWGSTKQFPHAEEGTERTVIEGHEAGRAPDPHELDRFARAGYSGIYNGSHAEKQAAQGAPDTPIAVSKDMCPDCRAWFRQRAIDRTFPQIVVDPVGARVFMPDGRIHFDPNPPGVLGPRGNPGGQRR